MVIVVSVLQCSSVASGCSAWRRISKSVLWYLEALRSHWFAHWLDGMGVACLNTGAVTRVCTNCRHATFKCNEPIVMSQRL